MIDQLPAGSVKYGNKLVAVKRNANGSVRCTFQAGNKLTDVTADRVVLALPFSTLRDADLTQSGFSSVKLRTISELGLGANAKIHVGVSRRPWVDQGFGGAAYTNLSGFQCGWDDSVNAPLPSGAFVFFPGGRQVSDGWSGATHGTAPAAQVSAYLGQLEPMFPGVTAAYTGKAYRDFWWSNPWSKGAYTCQQPGQYTTLFGAGAVPEGNVHFAGEHTSLEDFGYLNGAVETGERAARAIAG
jgi:monoamine oxidase